jgi:hypothetical protein
MKTKKTAATPDTKAVDKKSKLSLLERLKKRPLDENRLKFLNFLEPHERRGNK